MHANGKRFFVQFFIRFSFTEALAKTDEVWVDKVASQIENYICYGDLLKNAPFLDYALYKAVVIRLTEVSYGVQRLNIKETPI